MLNSMVPREGFVTEVDNYVSVVLDTNLTEELIEEGFVYEIISKIQNMRKDADFEGMDHIKVSFAGNDKVADIAAKNERTIAGKVLAESIAAGGELSISREWDVNGEKVTISIEKV